MPADWLHNSSTRYSKTEMSYTIIWEYSQECFQPKIGGKMRTSRLEKTIFLHEKSVFILNESLPHVKSASHRIHTSPSSNTKYLFVKTWRRDWITVFPRVTTGGDYFYFRTKRGRLIEGRLLFEEKRYLSSLVRGFIHSGDVKITWKVSLSVYRSAMPGNDVFSTTETL